MICRCPGRGNSEVSTHFRTPSFAKPSRFRRETNGASGLGLRENDASYENKTGRSRDSETAHGQRHRVMLMFYEICGGSSTPFLSVFIRGCFSAAAPSSDPYGPQ
jgi:hypothetical protein